MKKITLILSMLSVAFCSVAQNPKADAEEMEKRLKADNSAIPQGWTKGGTLNVALNQVQTSNWVAASEPYQVGITGIATAFGNRKKGTTLWLNNAMLQLGVMRSQSTFDQFRKNTDQLLASSMLAKQIKPKWYYGACFDLRTQIGNTLNYNAPTDSALRNRDGVDVLLPSKWARTQSFMTPGNIRLGVGAMYVPNKTLRVYISPLTASITTKLGAYLKNVDAFGVEAGKSVNFGLGALLRADYQNKFKNGVTYTSRLDLFTDYLDAPFTKVNTDWINAVGFTIGKNITVAANLNFRYYHNELQRLQWMEMLGFGFNYKL